MTKQEMMRKRSEAVRLIELLGANKQD